MNEVTKHDLSNELIKSILETNKIISESFASNNVIDRSEFITIIGKIAQCSKNTNTTLANLLEQSKIKTEKLSKLKQSITEISSIVYLEDLPCSDLLDLSKTLIKKQNEFMEMTIETLEDKAILV